ncbi:hypothetical protein F4780DRAFT_785350 [Xylariomycetidae sp. FL0641]|nr:hypothetical protein F4780DRAFT_785350 [Xylariomycetidae sp. FL0641]
MAQPQPPWAQASSEDQYFVLLTGANSGVGLGIGQRLIDEFLDSRPPTSHLILLPTTRSTRKSRDTILALRRHLLRTARDPKALPNLRARVPAGGPAFDPRTAVARVHVLGVRLDLCDLRSVYAAADRLVRGTVGDPTGVVAAEARIPRLDAAVFNAGVGGWAGLDWAAFARQFFRVGLVQSTTFPAFKKALPAAVMLDRAKLLGREDDGDDEKAKAEAEADDDDDPPALAEVFTANVFGHYVLAHELLPLLRRATPSEAPARVVWTSSVDAGHAHLDLGDLQAARRRPPYESSKRVTDLLVLTAGLPGVRDVSSAYFASSSSTSSSSDNNNNDNNSQPPRFYLTHPGVVCTPLFPLNCLLFLCYWCVMYVSRWLGSPWHPVTPYAGACAPAWAALRADPAELDAAPVKWGSATDRAGRAYPRRTEVEGWAWDGRVPGDDDDGDDAPEEARTRAGRKWDAGPLTPEARRRFEEDGRRVWEELESLRRKWEKALGRRGRGRGRGEGNGTA